MSPVIIYNRDCHHSSNQSASKAKPRPKERAKLPEAKPWQFQNMPPQDEGLDYPQALLSVFTLIYLGEGGWQYTERALPSLPGSKSTRKRRRSSWVLNIRPMSYWLTSFKEDQMKTTVVHVEGRTSLNMNRYLVFQLTQTQVTNVPRH